MRTRTYNERNPWLTLDDVLAFEPCWPLARLKYIAQGRKRARLTTLLCDKRIPANERDWLATLVLASNATDALFTAYRVAWSRFNNRKALDAFPNYLDRRMAFLHRFCSGEL